MNLFYKYIKCRIVWVLTLAVVLTSCISEDTNQTIDEQGSVYLSITRNQIAQGAINTDRIYFEDRVHSLAVFIFDSASGKLVDHVFDSSISLAIQNREYKFKLKSGNHDFYFIANTNLDESYDLSTVEKMKQYLATLQDFDSTLRNGATETKGFPMSRVYENQMINAGGTITNPIPFRPNGETTINLVRITAKIDISLIGDLSRVEFVNYRNSSEQYSFTAGGSRDLLISNIKLNRNEDTYTLYTPELLLEEVAWETHKEVINYVEIKLLDSDKIYQIPVIANGEKASQNYLKFARGLEAHSIDPNYSIERNQNYKITVILPATADGLIGVNYRRLPWKWFKIENHEYNKLIFDNPFIEIPDYSALVAGNTLIVHGTEPTAYIEFWLKSPKDAKWSANLTNGLEFEFDGNHYGVTDASEAGKKRFRIKAIAPIRDPNSLPITEFYITVDGAEVPFRARWINESGETEEVVFEKGNRLKIQQQS